jgi:hypothetical protein
MREHDQGQGTVSRRRVALRMKAIHQCILSNQLRHPARLRRIPDVHRQILHAVVNRHLKLGKANRAVPMRPRFGRQRPSPSKQTRGARTKRQSQLS